MLRLNTDPDGRRLVRAAVLTGVIYGLFALCLFLMPNRTVTVLPCGSSGVAGPSYRSVRLSLAASADVSDGISIASVGTDSDAKGIGSISSVSGTRSIPAANVSSSGAKNYARSGSAGPNPSAARADIVTGSGYADRPVHAPVQVISPKSSASGLPVADSKVADFQADSGPGSAAPADLSRKGDASTMARDSANADSDVALPQDGGTSRLAGKGAVPGGASASGSSGGAVDGTSGGADGYTFSGNGFLPDGVRESGRFSSWIDGAIRNRLIYPERARRRNLQGSVILALSVPADGSRCEASVIKSSGSAILDDAALSLLKSLFPAPVSPEKGFYSPVKIQYLIIQD